MDTPIKEQLARLPQWAQKYIADRERERFCAVRDLNEWVDGQTPSPVVIRELCGTGEDAGPTSKTRFVQTRRLTITWGGVELDIILRSSKDNGPERICLQYCPTNRHVTGMVALVPTHYQSLDLVSQSNMRT